MSEQPWRSVLDYHGPDWRDAGKQVELKAEDGTTVRGELEIPDFHFNGEDEVPHFEVAGHCLWDFDYWRVVP